MKLRRLVWILPLAALVFAVWILMRFVAYKSNFIEISFEDAAGIQVEQTQLRYRGVEIGVVKKITISEDNQAVIVTVALNKGAEHFAVKGSKFWIVRPRMNIQGISGLETLVEGSYITVRPGSPDQEKEKKFVALNGALVLPDLEDTVAFDLISLRAGSLNVGDSVRYRGIKIGILSKVDLSRNSKRVAMKMNIQHKYRRLIRRNSVFSRVVAVQAKLGLFDSELKIGSLESLLRGGIELHNPPQAAGLASAGQDFWLEEKPPEKSDEWAPTVKIY